MTRGISSHRSAAVINIFNRLFTMNTLLNILSSIAQTRARREQMRSYTVGIRPLNTRYNLMKDGQKLHKGSDPFDHDLKKKPSLNITLSLSL